MEIDLNSHILEFYFEYCQIEITGICNMRCEHCRAWKEPKVNMPLSLFKKSIDFVKSEAKDNFRLTLSGGEPFLHPDLIKMVKYAKEKGIENILITTNGSMVSLKVLKMLKEINVDKLTIQVSIDSVNRGEHDKFRNFKGAFDKAIETIDLVNKVGLISSLRASITPNKINQIEKLVKLALEKRVNRIGVGSVIPTGKGKINKSLLMNQKQKKKFLEKVSECKKKYPKINVVTEDPLKFALTDCPWEFGKFNIQKEGFYGGCTAGISGFNITSDGIITPCSVLLKKIVNLNKINIDKIKKIYVESEIIKNLLKRNLMGKCGNCKLRKLCGGCRAVAEGTSEDYLGEDITCFYKTNTK